MNDLFEYQRVGRRYELFSSGLDRIPNTSDDLYPKVSGKLVGKIGLIKYNIKPE